MTPEQLLREGLAVYGLPADAAVIEGLEEFSRRLLERNQVMNLTAITDPCDVAALHLLDCAYLLTAADFRGKSVVDVGTGAGFPGMPLRILEPNFDLTLLDSLGKRVDFLRETADAMGLRRVSGHEIRGERPGAAGGPQRHRPAGRRCGGRGGLHHSGDGGDPPGRPHPEGASHASGLSPCLRPHQESTPAIKPGHKCPKGLDLRKFF